MSIREDVDRGLEIVKKIYVLTQELKAIEERLEEAGLNGDQVPLEDGDREGRQWIARGTTAQVPVIFTADSIVGSFADSSVLHIKLKAIAGSKLTEFFKLSWQNKIKDGKAFRARAKELLADKAPSFITACLSVDKDGVPKNKITVAWHEPKPRPESSTKGAV